MSELDKRLQLLYPDHLGTPHNPTEHKGFRRPDLIKFVESMSSSELLALTKIFTVYSIKDGHYARIVLDIINYADPEVLLEIKKALDKAIERK